MFIKCIVKDCENHKYEGSFFGDFCAPCYEFITTGLGTHSQIYHNARKEWNALTDDEIEEIWNDAKIDGEVYDGFDLITTVEDIVWSKNK
jgi:hypothetical protein